MFKALLKTSFFIGVMASMSTSHAVRSQVDSVGTATALSAEQNFEKAEEKDKECKKLAREEKRAQQAQDSAGAEKKKKEKEKCEKMANAEKGQGMGNLGQLPQQQQTGDDTGPAGAGDSESQGVQFADPLDVFRDPVVGRKALVKAGLSPVRADKLLQRFARAENEGVSLDTKTGEVSSPSGDFSLASLNSVGGLSSLGYSPTDIREKIDKQSELLKGVLGGSAEPVESGGGSSGFAKKYNKDHEEFDFPDYKPSSETLAEQLKTGKRGYDQFSRNIAGGRIGVVGDNIFTMVSRRYRKKIRRKFFLP